MQKDRGGHARLLPAYRVLASTIGAALHRQRDSLSRTMRHKISVVYGVASVLGGCDGSLDSFFTSDISGAGQAVATS